VVCEPWLTQADPSEKAAGTAAVGLTSGLPVVAKELAAANAAE
jgi:hypothetical protein